MSCYSDSLNLILYILSLYYANLWKTSVMIISSWSYGSSSKLESSFPYSLQCAFVSHFFVYENLLLIG